MNVLSLFDGMSCGQNALNRANIKYNNYYASELDKYAIEVTQDNYPQTVQIGDATKIEASTLPEIDVLIGGSPCQGFSRIGNNLNFDDPRSMLFFNYVKILRTCKPKYFLLENVKMKKESEDIITDHLGVEPIEINSRLFVAHNRPRLYWTNIPLELPRQKKVAVEDIFEGQGFASSATVLRDVDGNRGVFFKRKEIFNCLTSTYYKGINAASRPAVSTKEGFLNEDRAAHRMLTPAECERLQTVPEGYTGCVSKTQRYKMLGNGWTVDVIAHILKGISR